jgi:biotin operon repressor BirA-like protein
MAGILESMRDTPARLLRLLSLLQASRDWPGSELAERLQVSRRTIRRDIQRLRDLGYPVQATMGAVGGYRLVAGTAMPPLLLDDEEAVAIAVGLRTAASHAVAGIDEASVRALAKLEQVLPSRLRYRVRTLGAATVPLTWDPRRPWIPSS